MQRQLNEYIKLSNGEKSNFTYKEFVYSETAIKKGIKNDPSEEQWKCIELLVEKILQPVRSEFGEVKITSGFRSVDLCLAIGSTVNSNHAKGQAADFILKNNKYTLIDVAEWIDKNCEYRELICEYFPDGWIHVAFRENENIKKLRIKDKKYNYKDVTIEEIKQIYL